MKLRLTITLAIAIAAVIAPTLQAAPGLNIDKCLDSGAYQGRNGYVRTYPGYPCAPFQNRVRVIRRVKQFLLDNGYRRAGMEVRVPTSKNWRLSKFATGSDRQIVITGIQDGDRMFVTVVKIAPRQIVVQEETVDFSWGTRTRLNLSFTA